MVVADQKPDPASQTRFFLRLVSWAAQWRLQVPTTAPRDAWLRLEDLWALPASVDPADSGLAVTALAFDALDVT